MKVTLTYSMEFEKEVEMTPEQYCQLHADHGYGGYFPKESFYQQVSISGNAVEELDRYFAERRGKGK